MNSASAISDQVPPAGPVAPDDVRILMRDAEGLPPEQLSAEVLRFVERTRGSAPQTADHALRLAVKRLPQDQAIGMAFCRLAEATDQPSLALGRWRMLCQRQPANVDAHLAYIEALLRGSPVGAARKAAATASAANPDHRELWAIQARLAERMHDWDAARACWDKVAELDPGDAGAAASAARAVRVNRAPAALALPLQPQIVPAAPIPSIADEAGEEIKRLLMGFESLGCDCEFGLLQRKFGGEPLGLLRFAATFPRSVLYLLRSRFEGIDDPEQVSISVRGRSYGVQHQPSGWRMHTNIKPSPEVSPAQVLRDQCRHAGFLRKKLLRELEHGSKIFVYQRHELTDAEIDAIYHAVQEYGPNLLMCVRLADAAHPAGAVEWRTERLMVGAIDRTGRRAGWDISADYWVYFCRIALARLETLTGKTAKGDPAAAGAAQGEADLPLSRAEVVG
jgi:hypothetical protein